MAFIEMDFASGGGSSKGLPLDGIKLLAYAQNENGSTFAIPSDTEFIICTSANAGENWNFSSDVSASSYTFINVLNKVGDVCTLTGASAKDKSTVACSQTITWTNATTVTYTRSSDFGAIQLYACKYV